AASFQQGRGPRSPGTIMEQRINRKVARLLHPVRQGVETCEVISSLPLLDLGGPEIVAVYGILAQVLALDLSVHGGSVAQGTNQLVEEKVFRAGTVEQEEGVVEVVLDLAEVQRLVAHR